MDTLVSIKAFLKSAMYDDILNSIVGFTKIGLFYSRINAGERQQENPMKQPSFPSMRIIRDYLIHRDIDDQLVFYYIIRITLPTTSDFSPRPSYLIMFEYLIFRA